ncbi:hypothetical protein EV1_044575 [Malus domestica]
MVWQQRIWGAVPFTAMVIVECAEVGVSTISKVAMAEGMSHFVFIVYYNALGTLLLLPFFIFRRNRRAPLTFRLICQFFLLGLIGSSGKILFFAGVKNSSAILAAAMANLTPIFTFLLAIIFRMEKLDLRKATGYAKSLGAIIAVGGALIVTLYDGPALLNSSWSSRLNHSTHRSVVSHSSTWIFGGMLLAIQCLVASTWNIAQAATVKDYPEEMTIVFFYTMFLTIQCTVISLIVERNNLSAWKMELPIEIIAILYAAICVSVFRISVHVWCLHKKGPVYVAMFKPLGIAIAAVVVVVFLGNTFYLGSLIGSIVISLGFYTVTYAQLKEKVIEVDNAVQRSEPSTQTTPLLRSSISNEREMGWRRWFQKDVLPFTAMVTVECTNVGLNVLFKAATLKGLSYYVFIVYSNLVATLVLLPLLFLFPNPRTGLPSFNLSLLLKVFLLGLIGFLADLCGYIGINYSSPTLDSAMSNLTPAFTFILAVFFRMESLALRSYSTQAKIMGTLVSISGALVVVLYKGPTILSTPSDPNPSPMLGTPPTNWVIGGLLCALQFLLNSTWYILQTHVMKAYPAEIVLVFLYNLCGTIISAPVCFIAETNLSAWRLRPDIALVAIIYSGCLGSSFGSLVHTWALHLKGPVYISIFKPLSIAIAAALSVIFLGDALSLGSVVGAIILSLGFYAVIWGKSKEEQMKPLPIGMGKAPLLESYKVENM